MSYNVTRIKSKHHVYIYTNSYEVHSKRIVEFFFISSLVVFHWVCTHAPHIHTHTQYYMHNIYIR